MSKSAPAAPDPVATAQAQSASNVETAIAQSQLNQIDQFTPEGSRVFTPLGDPTEQGIQRFQETVTLSPEGQAAFESQQRVDASLSDLAEGQLGRIGTNVGEEFTLAGLPAAPTAGDEGRQRVEEALFGRATSRLDPRFARQQEDLETQLANQGITRGSDAFSSAITDFEQGRTDAIDAALTSAIAQGGAEQSRQFGLEDVARQRGLEEQLTERNQPLNELAALLRGTGVEQPTFNPVPQTSVAGTDVAGITLGSSQLAAQNAASQNALLGDIAQAGATSAFLLSDRRYKDNITPVGKLDNGLVVYTFTYKGQDTVQLGLIAQEVEELHPNAVKEIAEIKHVNYAEAVK